MPIISVDSAIENLNNHQVVALPTETVYGLAAKINNDEALKKIFTTKSRPLFDPLIIHVKNIEQAKKYAEWDPISLLLADHFWPGPLTLVLKKNKIISDLITSGGETVALRQPNHPLFLNILNQLDIPLAAPSANLFGHTSPTQALHVISEFNNKVDVVDGATCSQGIESTIVEMDFTNQHLKILRLGIVSEQDLKDFFNLNKLDIKVSFVSQENAPGFLKNHYQPTAPFFLVYESQNSLAFQAKDLEKIPLELIANFNSSPKIQEWSLPQEAHLAARELYSRLREFSQSHQPSYLIVKTNWLKHDRWQSLLDRLKKASHGSFEFKNNLWCFHKK
jgi:L-threonylcarbamoyladenylate synthase